MSKLLQKSTKLDKTRQNSRKLDKTQQKSKKIDKNQQKSRKVEKTHEKSIKLFRSFFTWTPLLEPCISSQTNFLRFASVVLTETLEPMLLSVLVSGSELLELSVPNRGKQSLNQWKRTAKKRHCLVCNHPIYFSFFFFKNSAKLYKTACTKIS